MLTFIFQAFRTSSHTSSWWKHAKKQLKTWQIFYDSILSIISKQKASSFKYKFTQNTVDFLHILFICLQSRKALNVFINCHSLQNLNQSDSDNDDDDDNDEFDFNMSSWAQHLILLLSLLSAAISASTTEMWDDTHHKNNK